MLMQCFQFPFAPIPPSAGVRTTNRLGMTFAWIPAGPFYMGSPIKEKERRDDEHRHRVILSTGFFMAIHPITLSQFAQFVEATGYITDAEREGGAFCWTNGTWTRDARRYCGSPGFDQMDDHHVTCISW